MSKNPFAMPTNVEYVGQREPVQYLLIPFFKKWVATPAYYLSRSRYGRFFPLGELGGKPLDESSFKRKDDIARAVAREYEARGNELFEFWWKTSATRTSLHRDYLVWLSASYLRWQEYLAGPDSEPVSLLAFVQGS